MSTSMSASSKFPKILIVGLLFFLTLFGAVAYIAFQRKQSGVMPMDSSRIQQMRALERE